MSLQGIHIISYHLGKVVIFMTYTPLFTDEDENNGMLPSNGRDRNVCFVIYPESAPDNWQDIIQSWNVPAFKHQHNMIVRFFYLSIR